jgi:hypothetical protein
MSSTSRVDYVFDLIAPIAQQLNQTIKIRRPNDKGGTVSWACESIYRGPRLSDVRILHHIRGYLLLDNKECSVTM